MPNYRKFSDASVSELILDTMFLITIAIGYLFAMVHMFYTHQKHDGKPGLSVEDIRIAYYGHHQKTRLGAAIDGPMGVYLNRPSEQKIIRDWIKNGADELEYNKNIAPIINNICLRCHAKSTGLGLVSLESYQDILELTESDTGASIKSLVRISHIHFFGIAFLVILVGRIFILCEISPSLKRLIVAIPFIAVIVDILSWYLTKLSPEFAYLVVFAGALLSLSLLVQIVISVYHMWFYHPTKQQTGK